MPRPERDWVIDGCAGGVLLGRLKAHDSPAQVPMRRSDVDSPVCRVFVDLGEPEYSTNYEYGMVKPDRWQSK